MVEKSVHLKKAAQFDSENTVPARKSNGSAGRPANAEFLPERRNPVLSYVPQKTAKPDDVKQAIAQKFGGVEWLEIEGHPNREEIIRKYSALVQSLVEIVEKELKGMKLTSAKAQERFMECMLDAMKDMGLNMGSNFGLVEELMGATGEPPEASLFSYAVENNTWKCDTIAILVLDVARQAGLKADIAAGNWASTDAPHVFVVLADFGFDPLFSTHFPLSEIGEKYPQQPTVLSGPGDLNLLAYSAMANYSFGMQDYEKSAEYCTKALEIVPDNAAMHVLRAMARLNMKDYAGAKMDVGMGIVTGSEIMDVLSLAIGGVVKSAEGNHKDAIDILEVCVEKARLAVLASGKEGEFRDEEDAIKRLTPLMVLNYLYPLLGMVKLNAGDSKGALEAYGMAIKLGYAAPNVYLERGMARAKLGDNQGAIADFDEAIERGVQEPSAFVSRGIARFDVQDYPGAFDDFDMAIALGLKDKDTYFLRGRARYEMDFYADAILDFDMAIGLGADTKEIFSARGILRLMKGDYSGALEDIDRSIALGEGKPEIFRARGTALAKLERHSEAIPEFSSAIELGDQSVDIYFMRGASRFNTEDYLGAIEDLSKVTGREAEATDVAIEKKNLYYFIGIARFSTGQYQGALEDFDIAVKNGQNDANIYFKMGVARVETGDRAGAIRDFGNAIGLDGSSFEAHYNRGGLLYDAGDYKGAVEDLSAAARINPNSPGAFYHLATAYIRLGDFEAAEGALGKVVEMDPSAHSFHLRALCRSALGDAEGAQEDIEAAKKLDPANAEEYHLKYKLN
ncbi:MAG: tetratricopeptide repeat protein [Candidatus Micrarchaeia archaeon]